MKAYYYNCIVYLNAEDYENALDNCLTAEKYADKCIDYVSVGRLYNTKMIIYSKTLNLENAIKPAELSAHYYLTGKDTSRYITALNKIKVYFVHFIIFLYTFDTYIQFNNITFTTISLIVPAIIFILLLG